jgi:mannosyltransferase OCH1-like enzyme
MNIPERFIRVWVGGKPIPQQFETWWGEFKELHRYWEFITITSVEQVELPSELVPVISKITTCAGVSDVIRLLALYQMGGVYVDTDIMPLKHFGQLVDGGKPFLAKRSGRSFESAVIGSPPGHPAFEQLIQKLPAWFEQHKDRSASVQTGPAFVSSVLFGRPDVTHLPSHTFYPYNGFMAPKRPEKEKMFSSRSNFQDGMYAAHFSNHQWGGKCFTEAQLAELKAKFGGGDKND